MTGILLQNVSRRFDAIRAVDGISLDFPAGSFTALLGPSGCGKSTLLRLIAGFEAPDEGTVHIGGIVVADPAHQMPPEKRGVGIVFQSYALWPHMDVAGNVAYPLKTRGADRQTIAAKVEEVLAVVDLDGFGARKVDELSGGQRQRVALARCARRRCRHHPVRRAARQSRHASAGVDGRRLPRPSIGARVRRSSTSRTIRPRRWLWRTGSPCSTAEELLQVGPPSGDLPLAGRRQGGGFCLDAVQSSPQRPWSTTAAALRWRLPGSASRRVCAARRLEIYGFCCGLNRWRSPEAGLAATVASTTYRGPVHETRLRLDSGEEVMPRSPPALAVGERTHVAVTDAWVIPGS